MPYSFTFTLPSRATVPGTYSPVGTGYGRHHIIGRKYIQLLFAVSKDVGVEDKYLKRFAGWPKEGSSSTPPQDTELPTRFFWSPFNLFIGPDSTWRAWDPGSGVEKIRPPGFNATRWNALSAIPTYLETGMGATTLQGLADTASAIFSVNDDKAQVKTRLITLIKAVNDTGPGDKIPLYNFNEVEWAAIKDDTAFSRFLQRATDVAEAYRFARQESEGRLILADGPLDRRDPQYAFDQVVDDNLRGVKWLLKPSI